MMLNKFECICVDKGYFNIVKIKDIPKSCCTKSEIEVIDFDKTKDKLMTKLVKAEMSYSLKSCDCLKICKKSKRLDLIEIKSVKNYVEYYKEGVSKNPKEQVSHYDITKKYVDSNFLLQYLSHIIETELGSKECSKINKIKPNLIILIDTDIRKRSNLSFAMTLSYLSTSSNREIEKACIKALDCAINDVDISAPVKHLFCEEQLEEFYSEFN